MKEALALAAQNKSSLVISDIGLPDGSGYKLRSNLRERFRLKDTATSGYGAKADLAQSKVAGFKFHVTKPINLPELEDTLSNVFA